MIHQKSFITLAAFIMSFASLGTSAHPAQASILWDQSASISDNLAHQVFPDLPTLSLWHVGDVVFGAAVTISDIHTFNYPFAISPGATVPVQITLFPKTGSLPGPLDLPGVFGSGVAAYSVSAGVAEIHLGGLSISLAAGNYWIGITPVASNATNDQTFAREAAVAFGDPTAIRNPGGAFGHGTGWTDDFGTPRFDDMSLLIQGVVGASAVVPEASSVFVWSLLAITIGGVGWRQKRRAAC